MANVNGKILYTLPEIFWGRNKEKEEKIPTSQPNNFLSTYSSLVLLSEKLQESNQTDIIKPILVIQEHAARARSGRCASQHTEWCEAGLEGFCWVEDLLLNFFIAVFLCSGIGFSIEWITPPKITFFPHPSAWTCFWIFVLYHLWSVQNLPIKKPHEIFSFIAEKNVCHLLRSNLEEGIFPYRNCILKSVKIFWRCLWRP